MDLEIKLGSAWSKCLDNKIAATEQLLDTAQSHNENLTGMLSLPYVVNKLPCAAS